MGLHHSILYTRTYVHTRTYTQLFNVLGSVETHLLPCTLVSLMPQIVLAHNPAASSSDHVGTKTNSFTIENGRHLKSDARATEVFLLYQRLRENFFMDFNKLSCVRLRYIIVRTMTVF